jgi:hypothetical protein
MTVQGIQNLKLMAKLEDGSSIQFPIDVVIKNGEESTVLGTDNSGSQLMTIGGQTLQYVEPYVTNSSFEETQVKDRRGTYFNTDITFEFPKVDLYTNNQLKDFLFTSDGELAIANAVVIIRDLNNVDWISNYDLPSVVDSLEITTGGADNNYSMTLIGRSYNRIRRFEYL